VNKVGYDDYYIEDSSKEEKELIEDQFEHLPMQTLLTTKDLIKSMAYKKKKVPK